MLAVSSASASESLLPLIEALFDTTPSSESGQLLIESFLNIIALAGISGSRKARALWAGFFSQHLAQGMLVFVFFFPKKLLSQNQRLVLFPTL